MKRLLLAALALCAGNVFAVESVDFPSLAAQCAPGVHLDTLSAIVRHESGANPFAIGINAKGVRLPRQPVNREEAIATADWLKSNGYNFDGGFGQVNVKNLDWLGMSVADLFDPCKNLAGAARVITDCYKRAEGRYTDEQTALHAALSCYNTGNFRDGFSNGYVLKVAANATLDVPALVPVAKGSSEPLKLQGSAQQTPTTNAVKPLPDGIGDAFSRPNADAFSAPPEKAERGAAVAEEKD
jgi:type IV secretion system protein VirB1